MKQKVVVVTKCQQVQGLLQGIFIRAMITNCLMIKSKSILPEYTW